MIIAICNEDKSISDTIYTLLDEQLKRMQTDALIITYDSVEQLVSELDFQKFDLIYLDMFMQNIDGFEPGTVIHEKYPDACLVYVSSGDEYMEEVFENNPFAFLKKPLNPDIFIKTFNRVCRKLQDDVFYEFQVNHKLTKVKLKDSVFFESNGRKIRLYLSSGEMLEFYAKLDDVEKQIADITYCGYFLRTHKSFLVNESYICRKEKRAMFLKDGRKLPVSRAYQKIQS